jgi:hypothetical protein
MKPDLVDKNGDPIHIDFLQTFDKKGKKWVGEVIQVPQYSVIKGRCPQYAFHSNYDTWLHPEHANDYEKIKEEQNGKEIF